MEVVVCSCGMSLVMKHEDKLNIRAVVGGKLPIRKLQVSSVVISQGDMHAQSSFPHNNLYEFSLITIMRNR